MPDNALGELVRDENDMVVFYAVGGAAVATGAVLYYLGSRDPAERDSTRLTVAPPSGADGALVIVGGHVLIRALHALRCRSQRASADLAHAA